jgi:hypothetical protein
MEWCWSLSASILRPDGTDRGLQDFRGLNARRSDESIAAATYCTAVMVIASGLATQALGDGRSL